MIDKFARRCAVDLRDHPAQHGCAIDAADGSVIGKAGAKPVNLVGLDIDKEIRGRDVGEFIADRIAQGAVDLANSGEHRQTKTKRQND